jgi:phosphatidate cytidylyltransferase
MRPRAAVVHAGNLLMLVAAWLPLCCRTLNCPATGAVALAWPMIALSLGVIAVFADEMYRFRQPGGITGNLAAAVFTLVYVGLMFAVLIQLRLLWGLAAIAALVIPVKMGDTGAYTVGRLFGQHKMTPLLSPKKTWEGAIGHLSWAGLSAWATFTWLLPALQLSSSVPAAWRTLLLGLLLGVVGMLGDLAESLLKRDVGCKDSSRWMPGFGGVLDILDSILLAAPVAWFCWACGLVW